MKKLWSIPIIGVYLYCISVLVEAGFNSYFAIPPSFIESSLKENIVNFFLFFRLAENVAGLMRWWMWIIVLVPVAVIFIVSFFFKTSKIWTWSGILLMLIFILNSFNFGVTLAKSTPVFYVLSEECAPVSQSFDNSSFVIPTIYEGEALLVPFEGTSTKKIVGKFLVKNISDLGCAIEQKYVGVIGK